MTNHKRLLDDLRTAITQDPAIVPDVLSVVKDGMVQWEQSVKRRMDNNAYNGIIAALALPARPSNLNLDNHSHRAFARLVAVGLNLGRRRFGSMSKLEQRLRAFVSEADRMHSDDALQHYAVLGEQPISTVSGD